ncbi:MAG TPA: hypothetical protein VNH44_07570 [Micropepsaceae bacterium]|nr:hypothetical protein [Micropepsaceae bacterium]
MPTSSSKIRIAKPLACGLSAACAALLAFSAMAADSAPNFAPDNSTAWITLGAEFIAPPSGPGPVVGDPAHAPKPGQPAFRVADLSNPILQPWARDELNKANARALSGKAAYTPKERCWPVGVPGFLLYPVFPVYFLQTPKEVVMIWAEDHQVRHIYMNQPHSAHVTPSWFGESVGRYDGDTLVVDTVGMNTRTFIDNYRTPHTDRLHVIERFRMIDGGKTMEVKLHVEDPGAFTMPWDAIQRYRRIGAAGDADDPRVPKGPMEEMVCAENNGDIFNEGLDPIPTAAKADF